MGLAIQTIPPVYLVIENQHKTAKRSPQNIAESPQLRRSVSSADVLGPKPNQGMLGDLSSAQSRIKPPVPGSRASPGCRMITIVDHFLRI